MEGVQGLVTPCALGFSPHSERKACRALLWGAHTVEALLPRARAPIAPFHGMGGRGQPLGIAQRQGLFQRGRKELRERLPELLEPLQATPQLGPLVESDLSPTPSVEPRVARLHERPQRLSLGASTAAAPSGLPGGCVPVTLDAQVPRLAQRGPWRGPPLFRAGGLLGGWGARAPVAPCGLGGCQGVAGAGYRAHHRCDDLLDDRQRAPWRRHPTQDRGAGRGRARRAIGSDTPQRQGARVSGRWQPTQKGPDVVVLGVGGSDLREAALVTALIDRGEQTAGPVREVIGGDLPRKSRPGPVQDRRGQARLRLLFPLPPPSVGAGHRARRPGGLAREAPAPGGRARHLRPRVVPPEPSRGGWSACPVAPDRRGPHCRPGDPWCRHAAQRSAPDHADPTRRDGPSRAASAETAWPERPSDHSADTLAECRGDSTGRSRAAAGLRAP